MLLQNKRELILLEGIVPIVQKTHFLLAKLGTKSFAAEFNQALKESTPELEKEFFVDDGEKREVKYRWDDALTSNLKYNIAIMPLNEKIKTINQIFAKYFENESAFSNQIYMSLEEMKEMQEGGMEFGGHTHSHPSLASLNKEEQEKEITKSTDILRKSLKNINSFSYPYGHFNEETMKILKDNGYELAITIDVGINKGKNFDPLKVKRFDTNDIPFSKEGEESK